MNIVAIICAKYLFVVSVIISLWYWWKSEKTERKNFAVFNALTLPLAYIVAKVASHFYFDPRPFVTSGIAPLIQHAADNGFPSDHALLVGALAAVMTFFDRKLALIMWVIAILVAWGRVYVGVHHPIDVVSSLIISLVVALVVYLFRKNKNNHA